MYDLSMGCAGLRAIRWCAQAHTYTGRGTSPSESNQFRERKLPGQPQGCQRPALIEAGAGGAPAGG